MTVPNPAGLTAALNALGGADDTLASRVLALWSEPGRGYHDAEHLGEVLERLRELAEAGVPAAASSEVVLAAWFHDAVYAGRPGEDEQASADLAARWLSGAGICPEPVAEVGRLVLLTREHRPAADDQPGQALCDADLAILAAPADRYRRYAQDVRREYRHVPDPLFRVGRRRVLRTLLARARQADPAPLFNTAPAQQWTAAAVANLEAELAR